MTVSDDMFGYLPIQASADGDEQRRIAEAMEGAEHYGPAVRMFEWALVFIEGGAANEAYGQAVERRDACRAAALKCGDDVNIAFEATNDEILDDVQRFAQQYYTRQVAALGERLDRLMARNKWAAVAEAVDAARGSVRFATGSARKQADYQCDLCSGTALVELGRYAEAVEPLERAHGQADERVYPKDAAQCAYRYGVALFHTGADRAAGVLCEAARELSCVWENDDDRAVDRSNDQGDECLCLLAELHAKQLGAPRDQALTAAQALLDVARPQGDAAAAKFDKTAARARACIQADTLLKEAVACRRRREIDDATTALDDAEQHARTAGATSFTDLIDAERDELSLCDPKQLEQHATAIREMLRSDNLAEADELYGKLHDRQGDSDALSAIARTIAQAKQAQADRQITRADELLGAGEIDQAGAALTTARDLAASVDYVPPDLARVRGRLSHIQANQMGAEAKRLSEAGDYAAAMALAKDARALPNLDSETAEKIAKMFGDLSSGRDRAAMQCRQRLKTFIQEGQWDQARGVLTEARSNGTDGKAQAERKKIEGYFRATDLLEQAEGLLARSKTVAAATAVEGVFQATGVVALLDRAKDIASRIAELDKTIASHYVDQDASTKYLLISALVGVPLGGALGWLGETSIFAALIHAIWMAAMTTALFWGACICTVGRTIPAHDGRVHGLTVLCTGLIAALLSYPLYWWICLPMAAGLYAGLELVLNRMCPAQKPGRDPGTNDETSEG